MSTGTMRDRAAFSRLTGSEDDYGNAVEAWADLFTVWADVRETLGKEKVAAGAIEAANTATVRIRSSTQSRGITTADRVTFRGALWNIRSIIAVSNNGAMLELLCEKGVGV
jgi:SPP1 family predicted phage head-tail adaptor